MITGSPERTLEFILQELLDAGITFKNVYDIGANEGNWYRKWKHKFPRETMFYLIEAFAGNKLLGPWALFESRSRKNCRPWRT